MSQQSPTKTRVLESLYGEVAVGAHQMSAGAAAPTERVFAGAVKLLMCNPSTEDSLSFELVVPRSTETDVATVTVTPTVRWTAISTTTANTTVKWYMDYTYAQPSLVADSAADAVSIFPAVSTLTTINTLNGHEYRRNLVTAFQPLSMPVRNFLPSMVLMGNVRISSTSTVADSLVGMLAVGCSYLEGPCGTASITP